MTNKTPMPLSDKERALIVALRGPFKHGEVILVMRDGTPQYIKQAWKSDALEGKKDS